MLLLIGCLIPASTAAHASASGIEADPFTVTITEIMYDPGDQNGVPGADLEFLEIYNRSGTTVDLTGVSFTSGVSFSFAPGTTLASNAYLVLASTSTAFQNRYGFAPHGEYIGQLNNGGEGITMNAADGSQLISMQYDNQPPWPALAAGQGHSLVLLDADNAAVDLSSAGSWHSSAYHGGSPGAIDPWNSLAHPTVVINEILAHTDPPLTDAVELANIGTDTIPIGGWYLTDNSAEPRKFRIPDGIELAPGGFHMFTDGELGFRFSALGEEIYLTAADPQGNFTGYSHGFAYGVSPNGVSFGRHITSGGEEHFPLQQARTLGEANAGPLVGPVVISEIMYHPPLGDDEYIRLTNRTDTPAPLYDPSFPANTWHVDGVGNYVIPQGTILEPGMDLLVVPLEPTLFRSKYNISLEIQVAGPYTGTLSNTGELIALLRPDTQNLDGSVPYYASDEVNYSATVPWPPMADGYGPSLLRLDVNEYGNDWGNWRAIPLNPLFLPIAARETP